MCTPRVEPALTRIPPSKVGKSSSSSSSAQDPWLQDDPWSRKSGGVRARQVPERNPRPNQRSTVQSTCGDKQTDPQHQHWQHGDSRDATLDCGCDRCIGAMTRWNPGTDGNAGGANVEFDNGSCTMGCTCTTKDERSRTIAERHHSWEMPWIRCSIECHTLGTTSRTCKGVGCTPSSLTSTYSAGGRRFSVRPEREVICEKLREIFEQEPGVREWWTLGKLVTSSSLRCCRAHSALFENPRVTASRQVGRTGSSDSSCPRVANGTT